MQRGKLGPDDLQEETVPKATGSPKMITKKKTNKNNMKIGPVRPQKRIHHVIHQHLHHSHHHHLHRQHQHPEQHILRRRCRDSLCTGSDECGRDVGHSTLFSQAAVHIQADPNESNREPEHIHMTHRRQDQRDSMEHRGIRPSSSDRLSYCDPNETQTGTR